MLLIYLCRRNSATGSSKGCASPLSFAWSHQPSAPPFWYMDRPIFTPVYSSSFGTNHASQWRIVAKAAILLSYFLFNSHQAIVYHINTRQLRRAVAVKEGRGQSDPRHPVTRNHNRAIFLSTLFFSLSLLPSNPFFPPSRCLLPHLRFSRTPIATTP